MAIIVNLVIILYDINMVTMENKDITVLLKEFYAYSLVTKSATEAMFLALKEALSKLDPIMAVQFEQSFRKTLTRMNDDNLINHPLYDQSLSQSLLQVLLPPSGDAESKG